MSNGKPKLLLLLVTTKFYKPKLYKFWTPFTSWNIKKTNELKNQVKFLMDYMTIFETLLMSVHQVGNNIERC